MRPFFFFCDASSNLSRLSHPSKIYRRSSFFIRTGLVSSPLLRWNFSASVYSTPTPPSCGPTGEEESAEFSQSYVICKKHLRSRLKSVMRRCPSVSYSTRTRAGHDLFLIPCTLHPRSSTLNVEPTSPPPPSSTSLGAKDEGEVYMEEKESSYICTPISPCVRLPDSKDELPLLEQTTPSPSSRTSTHGSRLRVGSEGSSLAFISNMASFKCTVHNWLRYKNSFLVSLCASPLFLACTAVDPCKGLLQGKMQARTPFSYTTFVRCIQHQEKRRMCDMVWADPRNNVDAGWICGAWKPCWRSPKIEISSTPRELSRHPALTPLPFSAEKKKIWTKDEGSGENDISPSIVSESLTTGKTRGEKANLQQVVCARHHILRYPPYMEKVRPADDNLALVFVCRPSFRCSLAHTCVDPFGFAFETDFILLAKQRYLNFKLHASSSLPEVDARGKGREGNKCSPIQKVDRLQPRPGSWYCLNPRCKRVNMSTCYWCFYCRTPQTLACERMAWDEEKTSYPGRKGDWACLVCRKMNFQVERRKPEEVLSPRQVTKCAFCRSSKTTKSPVLT